MTGETLKSPGKNLHRL